MLMHTRKVETCLESIYIGHKPLEYLGLFPCTGPWDAMGAGHYALEYLPFISMGLAQEAILDGLWPCLEISFAKPRNSRKCIVPPPEFAFHITFIIPSVLLLWDASFHFHNFWPPFILVCIFVIFNMLYKEEKKKVKIKPFD